MSLIDCLKNVVKGEFLTCAKAQNGSRTIELTEGPADGEVMRIKITEIPDSTRVLAIRMTTNHFSLLQGEYNRICDYFLVFQSRAKYDVAFIEMKKSLSHASKNKAREQLKCSLPIWHYLASFCEIECEIQIPKLSIKRFFLAENEGRGMLDKQPTRVTHRPRVHIFTGTEFPMSTFTS